MNGIRAAILTTGALAALALPMAASAAAAPDGAFGSYGRWHARAQVVVVAKAGTFSRMCPKLGGAGLVNGQWCDPLSLAIYPRGKRLQVAGYIMIGGSRWWWSERFGWIAGRDLWAGRWAR